MGEVEPSTNRVEAFRTFAKLIESGAQLVDGAASQAQAAVAAEGSSAGRDRVAVASASNAHDAAAFSRVAGQRVQLLQVLKRLQGSAAIHRGNFAEVGALVTLEEADELDTLDALESLRYLTKTAVNFDINSGSIADDEPTTDTDALATLEETVRDAADINEAAALLRATDATRRAVLNCFVVPGGALREITIGEKPYRAISPESPLGQALIENEAQVGDFVSYAIGKGSSRKSPPMRHFKVLSVE